MFEASYLPFNLPEIGEEEIGAVVETMRSGWLTTGARTAAFERDFEAYTGARHALALNSCTAALHLALQRRFLVLGEVDAGGVFQLGRHRAERHGFG